MYYEATYIVFTQEYFKILSIMKWYRPQNIVWNNFGAISFSWTYHFPDYFMFFFCGHMKKRSILAKETFPLTICNFASKHYYVDETNTENCFGS